MVDAYYYLTDCEKSTNLVCNQTIGRPSDPIDRCAMFDGSDFIKIVETLPGRVLYALIADEAMDYCGYLGRFPPTVNQCYGTEGWRFYEMKCTTWADNDNGTATNSTSTGPDQPSGTDEGSSSTENPGQSNDAPSTTSGTQMDTSNKVALGVGLGIGIPTILLSIVFGIRLWYHQSYSISLFLPRIRLPSALMV